MRGIKWHIVGRLVAAIGAAVVGVGVDTAALDGAVAEALRAVFAVAPTLFGS